MNEDSGNNNGGKAEIRMGQFKNRGALRPDELRRRREDQALSLRKQKREESIAKRRFNTISDNSNNLDIINDNNNINNNNNNIGNNLNGDYDFNNLNTFAKDIFTSSDPSFLLLATRSIRKMLSQENNPPISIVINYGLIPKFVEFLKYNDSELQFESAWVLTNIASGSTNDTLAVANSGAIEIFVDLLSSNNIELCEQAVWALGNIAGDSPNSRDQVLHSNALKPLLNILQSNNLRESMIRNAAWTLCNFCRGKNPQVDFSIISPALPVLAQLLNSNDDDVIIDACWALSYLTDGPNNKIESIIQTGVPSRLIELLDYNLSTVQTPALRTVGNIVTGTDTQTQIIINCGVLNKLLNLLMSPKPNLVKETCWTISNITAGTVDQILSVINANIFPMLISYFKSAEFKIKREICWAISNATSGGLHNPEIITYLVEQGCIGPLVDVLSCPDDKVIRCSLEGLSNILEVGRLLSNNGNFMRKFIEEANGDSLINTLQYSSNHDISVAATTLYDKFFSQPNDNDDMNLTTDVNQGEFEFNVDQMNTPSGGFNF